ncbi:hypothetical protein ACHHYP_00485, partial [Achlya hypogyna]
LFIVYLDATLEDLAQTLGEEANLLGRTIAYADDTDFVCHDEAAMTAIKTQAPPVFAQWDLKMNEDKTEETQVYRSTDVDAPTHAASLAWHTTKKLGSLLDDAADLRARKQLGTAAFNSMWKIWMRRGLTSEGNRTRLYKCYVLPVLLYNCGTWALTPTSLASLDSFHRRQLRRLLGVFYPNTITDVALYERCASVPLSELVARQRWRLLGHVLRLPEDVPANVAAARFFDPSAQSRFLGRTKLTLPIVLHRDLQSLTPPLSLASTDDLKDLRSCAQDHEAWTELTERIVMSQTRGRKRRRVTTEEEDAAPRRSQHARGPASE